MLFRSQFVAYPNHCLDHERVRWIQLDLAAEPINYILQHGVIDLLAISPHSLVEFLDCDILSRSIHEVIQKTQFQVGQTDGVAILKKDHSLGGEQLQRSHL